MPLYRHTQRSPLVWPIVAVTAAIVFFAATMAQVGYVLLFAMLIFAMAVPWIFGSMTAEVTEDELIWFFGPGIWRKRIKLMDIGNVEQVRNQWWWGWGIRYYGKGWLYCVYGLDAIEITTLAGKMIRVGTDRPTELAAAVSARIKSDNLHGQ